MTIGIVADTGQINQLKFITMETKIKSIKSKILHEIEKTKEESHHCEIFYSKGKIHFLQNMYSFMLKTEYNLNQSGGEFNKKDFFDKIDNETTKRIDAFVNTKNKKDIIYYQEGIIESSNIIRRYVNGWIDLIKIDY
jgi:hypothetical protein